MDAEDKVGLKNQRQFIQEENLPSTSTIGDIRTQSIPVYISSQNN